MKDEIVKELKNVGAVIMFGSFSDYDRFKKSGLFDNIPFNKKEGFKMDTIDGIKVIYIEGGLRRIEDAIWGKK